MAEDALREAILADPDDEAARLVYADALQTEGDPRGELIAVQCELARLGCGPERLFLEWVGDTLADRAALENGRIPRLRKREATLLKKHAAGWARAELPSAAPADRARFWRGFVEHVTWNVGSRYDIGAAMKRAPIRSVMPTNEGSSKKLATFFEQPALERVEELYVLSEVGTVPISTAKLTGLRRLLLSHMGGAHQLSIMAAAPCWERLSALVLNGFSLADVDLGALFAKMTRLDELQLIDTRLGAVAAAKLADLPRIGELKVLGIRHGRLGASHAVPLLGHAKIAAGLRALDLRSNKLGAADTTLLGAGFPSLRVLDLGNNPLPTNAIESLVGGKGLGELLALGLQKSNIDDERLGLLVASPLMSRVSSLDLRKNVITDAGAAALLRAKDLSRLRVLYLGGNALTAEGKKRLKQAKELAEVTLHV